MLRIRPSGVPMINPSARLSNTALRRATCKAISRASGFDAPGAA
jgi:hypothetical protein